MKVINMKKSGLVKMFLSLPQNIFLTRGLFCVLFLEDFFNWLGIFRNIYFWSRVNEEQFALILSYPIGEER